MDARKWTMAVGLWAGLGWASAQTPAVPAKPPGPSGEARQEERPKAGMFRRLDTDGDGALSAEEFFASERLSRVPEEKRQEIFRRLDKDGDGKIQPGELAGLREGKPPGHGGRLPRLEELDTDRSGGISFDEFRKGAFVSKLPEERQRALFTQMDRDGDGQLTPKDRPPGDGHGGPPVGRIAALDKDKSGGVSFEEFVQGEWVQKMPAERQREMFDHLDRDHDGQIMPKDAQNGPAHGGQGNRQPDAPTNKPDGSSGRGPNLKALDRDGDGTLNFEEFRQSPILRGLSEDEQEKRFENLDKNKDLKLQPDEMSGPRHEGRNKAAPGAQEPAAPPPAGPTGGTV